MNRTIGKYEIGAEQGKGAYGKVYQGIDTTTGAQVALKF